MAENETDHQAEADPQPDAAEAAMDGAQESLEQVKQVVDESTVGLDTAESPSEATDDGRPVGDSGIELLGDVDLHVMIELGRASMLVEDVLKLNQGSVVELDKLAGDPVDVYVNQRLIARGEVLVLNDTFCIRISEIVADLEEQAETAAEET